MTFKNIVTVTLNPALDVTMYVDGLESDRDKNVIMSERVDAGGKGVNVSKALATCGVPTICVVAAGEENLLTFDTSLKTFGVRAKFITGSGRIRENFKLIRPDGKMVTLDRMGSAGVNTTGEVELAIKEALPDAADSLVVFGGSIPKGVNRGSFVDVIKHTMSRGAKVAIDSTAVDKTVLEWLMPYIIKPNRSELAELFGKETLTNEEVIHCAHELSKAGIEHVLVSLGGDGLIYATKDGYYTAWARVQDVRSTIGAGDTALAGFIFGLSQGISGAKLAAQACAFGSASVLNEGTTPPSRYQIEETFNNVTVSTLMPYTD